MTRRQARRVVVTAGPTREYVDPVRYLGNESSGKMGFEIARAAQEQGDEVVLVAGHGASSGCFFASDSARAVVCLAFHGGPACLESFDRGDAFAGLGMAQQPGRGGAHVGPGQRLELLEQIGALHNS